MDTLPTDDALEYLRACAANCRLLDDFARRCVRPILVRELNVLPARRICHAMFVRVQAWLGSIVKLDAPSDFQAASAASRAVYETAIDMVLVQHEEKQSMRKLMSWERSCKLKYAERLVAFGDDQHAREFLDGNKEEILADRAATWGTNKQGKSLSPDRWTGRSLEQDAKKAEQFESAGFVSFYAENYTRTCWHVHGSGVVGLLEVPTRDFPMIAASALHCVCHFSLVCFEYALRLLNVFDEISEIRISQLKETLGVTALMILRSATR